MTTTILDLNLRLVADRIRGLGKPEESFTFDANPREIRRGWLDYRRRGFTEADAGPLLAIMRGAKRADSVYDGSYLAATHAWRALAALGITEAAPALVALRRVLTIPNEPYDVDFPAVCGALGSAIVPHLRTRLVRSSRGWEVPSAMVEGLEAVAREHATLRNEIAQILAQQLEAYRTQSRWLNGSLVQALVQLGRVEHRDLLLRVVTQGYVHRSLSSGPADLNEWLEDCVWLREQGIGW